MAIQSALYLYSTLCLKQIRYLFGSTGVQTWQARRTQQSSCTPFGGIRMPLSPRRHREVLPVHAQKKIASTQAVCKPLYEQQGSAGGLT